jgi:2-C-methyl-D-erythritol 4-phosphate cytidylyltransferase
MGKKYTIIVAGGKGKRMQTDIPKQFISIVGKPLLMHTLYKFYQYDDAMKIILVLPASQIKFWQELCQIHHCTIPHQIVLGGETRFHSVLNGLSAISDSGIVAIHDGVRPFVSIETISRCFALAEKKI